MNITNIQSIAAPILAPIAPAILFGNSLHAGMIADGVQPTLAAVGAVLGTGGVELSGALACSMAVLAYHKRDNKIMWISILAAVIYAIFVMIGIAQAQHTATFAGAVVISLVAYAMQGVWQSYTNKLRIEQAESDQRIREMEAARKLTNAQTRQMKAGGSVQVSTAVGHSFQQLDPAVIAEIQAYWQSNPGASLREVGGACGVSPMTAGKYKPQEPS